MENQSFDLLAINETRLDDSVTDNLIATKDYSVIGKDRNCQGDGVCIYLRNTINYRLRVDPIAEGLEAVCVEIIKLNSKPFAMIACYRPPNSSVNHADDIFFQSFVNLIATLDSEEKEIIILGDLNCDISAPIPSTYTKKLLALFEYYQLNQLINEPSRITESTRTTIDLILTNDPPKIVQSGVIQIGISDHNLIFTIRKFNICKSGAHKYITSRSFKHFNQNRHLNDLKLVDLNSLNQFSNVNLMWNEWSQLFLSVIDKHASIKRKRIKSAKFPWITPLV